MTLKDNSKLREDLIKIMRGENLKPIIMEATNAEAHSKQEIESYIVENYLAFKNMAKTVRVCSRYFGFPIGIARVKNTLVKHNVKIDFPKCANKSHYERDLYESA